MIKLNAVKSLMTLVLPLMAAFLAQKGMQFIDTLMMGWIGPSALAAGALGTSLFMTVLVFCMGTLSSVGVFIVRAKGANDPEEIKTSLKHGLYIAVFLSLPCMLILWYSPYVLLNLGEDPDVIKNVCALLNGLVWGLPGFLLFLVMREFISAFSLTRVVMLVALGSIPVTFIGNYLLIYGKLGLPQLAVAGIGYAGAIVMWGMFLSLLIFSKKHPTLKKYSVLNSVKVDISKFKEILYIGLPSGALLILESGMFLFAAIVMGYFGMNALAAHQIAMQCSSIAYSVPFALSMATALQVGHALGEKNVDKAKQAVLIGLILGLFITALIAVFFILFRSQLTGLFLVGNESDFSKIKNLATQFLIISALFQCFDGIQSIANGALRGLKDTFIPMILSLGCYWILGIGSAYYFAFYTSAGPLGIWYGFTLGLTSIAIILTWRLFFRLKYEKRA